MNTPKEWKGQVAVITGGADGLGFALAGRLVQRGVIVALWDYQEEKVREAACALGENARAQKVDVTRPGDVQAAAAELLAEFGHIDILVNCAGITGKTNTPSHQVDLADFDRVMEINLRGSLITFQAVIGSMLEQNYGRVLHVASISGKEGNAGMLAYSTSKAAVIGMTKVQGKEYAETGVRINAIAPAVVQTKLVEVLPEEQVRYMTDKIPTKRCGTLEEFAATAEFIVSPENSFTTAFTYDLSGGRAVY
ncbi:MAG TPA: SDR family NAD(P)-dependent oxidoreductase [Chthoniobacteraceae bacterium]|nr:SDR family NAD(P)-dependent oxidoreductase [Chthoniobacteraceae bacterium]